MISELYSKEPQSIYTFKKGDLITRIQPSIRTDYRTNENLGVETTVIQGQDTSYMGTPLEFNCIENGVIYCKVLEMTKIIGKDIFTKLRLEQWEEGWIPFVIPDGLTLDNCL